MTKKKLRVAVVFGGRSVEHEVSIVSARSFVAAMDKDKYDVVLIGIDSRGKWLLVGDSFDGVGKRLLPDSGKPLQLLCDGSQKGQSAGAAKASQELGQIDVVVPLVHGSFGEDGCIQGLCELADLPYVGAGVLGSSLGMDKITMKQVLMSHDIPVVEFVPVTKWAYDKSPRDIKELVGDEVEYPCFVKPSNGGSSVGMTKVKSASKLDAAIKLALQYDRRVIVERAIKGREFECSVLGNGKDMKASVVGEVVPCNEFYDYNAKYVDDKSKLIIPAKLDKDLVEEIKSTAIRAFVLLDMYGMARADFLFEKETEEVFLSELNTIPGFTSISMYPKLWEASKLHYPKLVDRLIELALERHAEKAERKYDYSG